MKTWLVLFGIINWWNPLFPSKYGRMIRYNKHTIEREQSKHTWKYWPKYRRTSTIIWYTNTETKKAASIKTVYNFNRSLVCVCHRFQCSLLQRAWWCWAVNVVLVVRYVHFMLALWCCGGVYWLLLPPYGPRMHCQKFYLTRPLYVLLGLRVWRHLPWLLCCWLLMGCFHWVLWIGDLFSCLFGALSMLCRACCCGHAVGRKWHVYRSSLTWIASGA